MKRILIGSALVCLLAAFTWGAAVAEPYVYPSGVKGYDAADLVKAFKANEFAIAKQVKGKYIVVSGIIEKVSGENYFKNTKDIMSHKGNFPAVNIGGIMGFTGYLLNDSVDPAILNPSDGILLYCKDTQKGLVAGVQGDCQVVSTGPVNQSGKLQASYRNDELMKLLKDN